MDRDGLINKRVNHCALNLTRIYSNALNLRSPSELSGHRFIRCTSSLPVVGLWPYQNHLLTPLTRAYSQQHINHAGEAVAKRIVDDKFNTRAQVLTPIC